ncbi:MAG: formimidoylglutamate deiminase [Rhodospirillaceae bacterium]|nr:formimidoylglutamate deiminase [Rhodospirillaceae bacterium]|tara:strand:+ start:7946 stop:9325 length:1380 start_codon:yes stop_codon:yes gene_type:complete
MTDYFAKSALLPRGWSDDVLITVDDNGDIESLMPNSRASRGAVRLNGPALPGISNLHSHAFQRAMAGLAERARTGSQDSFWTWRDIMYKFLARLTPQQVGAIAAQLYIEMLKSGYTTVGEFHYLHHQSDGTPYDDLGEMAHWVVGAAQRTGLAITLLPVLYTYSGFGAQTHKPQQRRFINGADRFQRLIGDLHQRYSDDPQFTLGIAPHSIRAVSKGVLSEALTGLNRIDATAPIHIHIAEQTKEVDDCVAWSNQRPVTWLYSNFQVDERWCLVHATHINRMESWMVAHSRAVAGLCPTTEANLGDGIFPLGLYMRGEGRFGIGSDSHISVSPVEELRWLEYVQRLRRQLRNVTASERQRHVGARLWNAALAGGAQALGRKTDGLKTGNRADFISLDGDHPLLVGRKGHAITDSLVFSGNTNPVSDVVVGGRHVVAEGHHAEEEKIARAYRKAIGELMA